MGKKFFPLRFVLTFILSLGIVGWSLSAIRSRNGNREVAFDLNLREAIDDAAVTLTGSEFKKESAKGQDAAKSFKGRGLSGFWNGKQRIVKKVQPVVQQASGNGADGSAVKTAVQAAQHDQKRLVTIKPGDTLIKIFRQHHLRDSDAIQIGKLKGMEGLRRLQVGKTMLLSLHDGELISLEYNGNHLKRLIASRDGNGWRCSDQVVKADSKNRFLSFTLGRDFTDSCVRSGVPRRLAGEISRALSQRVNLRSLKGGERLSVAYRELRVDGELVKSPELIGLDFFAGNKKLRLIAFTNDSGIRSYFTPDGKGTQPQFSRYPLSNFRVTSKFSKARRHPIYGTLRPHLGVDLSAKYGTPIYSTSDGVIDFSGFQRGYGRLIVVKNGQYSTRYAHLSRFAQGVRRGTRVKRGEVIGYVGSSGVSTSAHLHYEFRINGVPYDPQRVRLPGESLLASRQRNRFIAVVKQVGGYLDSEQTKQSKALAVATGDSAKGIRFGRRS